MNRTEETLTAATKLSLQALALRRLAERSEHAGAAHEVATELRVEAKESANLAGVVINPADVPHVPESELRSRLEDVIARMYSDAMPDHGEAAHMLEGIADGYACRWQSLG